MECIEESQLMVLQHDSRCEVAEGKGEFLFHIIYSGSIISRATQATLSYIPPLWLIARFKY